MYNVSSLLADLKFQKGSQQYKNFTWMAPANFKLLINLINPKIVKRDTRFQVAIPVQNRMAVTLA
jgi:hypothetical protein